MVSGRPGAVVFASICTTPAFVPALNVTVTKPFSFVESADGEMNSVPPRLGDTENRTYALEVASIGRPSESLATNVNVADSLAPVPRIDNAVVELDANSSDATRRVAPVPTI